jgi:hypothetical protein
MVTLRQDDKGNFSVRKRLLALAALLGSTHAIRAESVWEVIQRYGWTGRWSSDECRTSPKPPYHFREVFSQDAAGLARREVDYGPERGLLLSFVDEAQILSPMILKARVRNADPNWGKQNCLVADVVVLKEVDPQTQKITRYRGLSLVMSDGRTLIKDGIIDAPGRVHHGKPSVWLYKCESAVSSLEKLLNLATD